MALGYGHLGAEAGADGVFGIDLLCDDLAGQTDDCVSIIRQDSAPVGDSDGYLEADV